MISDRVSDFQCSKIFFCFERRIRERERERVIMGTFQSVEVRLSHTYSIALFMKEIYLNFNSIFHSLSSS